jgi:enoyl-CoA hydratase/carnithine racemase
MSNPIIFSVTNAVTTISINDAPYNRMTLEYIDELETMLPELKNDNAIRAIVFTAEGLEHFSVGMNLKQLPEGAKQKGGIDAVFDQRLRVLKRFCRFTGRYASVHGKA